VTRHALKKDFSDKIAFAGVGTTDFGAMYRDLDPERSGYQLGLTAFKQALDDCGLTRDDVDGLLTSRVEDLTRMSEILGIRHPRFVSTLPGGGRYSGLGIEYAAMAIYSGLANVVALIYGNNGRSVGARYGGEDVEGGGPEPTGANYNAPYGMTSPGGQWAHMFRRHQDLYGTKEEVLGTISMNNRKNASLNPIAVMREPFTMEQYLGTRYIAEPLRLLDYCLINDGGVCIILTSAERARDLKKPPVYLTATQAGADLGPQYLSPEFYRTALGGIGDDIFGVAGIDRKDIGFAQIYDNFTPTVLMSLEGLGFCGEGESGDWVTPERIALDGELPVNTSGGHTSESYMQGWATQVEAVRQLRGEAGERQVADVDHGLYVCTRLCA
jgi:acetyl-CoA acetyltransferase